MPGMYALLVGVSSEENLHALLMEKSNKRESTIVSTSLQPSEPYSRGLIPMFSYSNLPSALVPVATVSIKSAAAPSLLSTSQHFLPNKHTEV